MSGDAQPRKRRDKRRRKEEEELYPNLKDTDEIIHVYKDANTGGNIVTKIIFFCLMGGIAIMVGFILMEHRGTTDEDHDLAAKETPWSLQFDDWSKLITVPDLVPDFMNGEQGDHDHHASHSSGEADDHGGEHEDSGHEEDHGHEEPAQDTRGAGWFSFGLPSWGGSTDDAVPAEHEVEEPEVTSSWFSMNYFGGGDEKVEEEPIKDHEEAPVSAEVESSPLSEEQEEETYDNDQEEEDEENTAEDEENTAEEELDEEENVSRGPYDNDDDDEPLTQEQFDEEEEQNLSMLAEESEEEEPQSAEIEENEEPTSGEGEEDDDPRGSVFPRRSSIIEEDEAESAEQDEEAETEPENVRDASEEELFPEAIEALQREALELIREQKEAERTASVDEELPEEEEPGEDQPAEDQEEETEGMALKFGVGIALVVVAHVVLVKKWNSWAEGNEAQTVRSSSPVPSSHVPPTPSRTPAPTPEPPKSETPLADWAEDAIKAMEMPEVEATSPRTPSPELDEEEFEEESEPEEEEEDLSEDVPPINPKIYEELIAKYGKPTPESSDAEASDDGNREYSDGGEVESVGEEESGGELDESEPEEEQRWTNVKKPVEVESGSEGEEEEEESEDEPPPSKPPQGGGRSLNEPVDHEEVLLRRQLELADEEFNFERYESALNSYRKVLSSKPQNARALHGVAQVLDKQAEQRRSNVLLQEAIDSYLQLLSLDNIPEAIFLSAAKRAINRLRFRGSHMKAALVHKKLIDRFDDIVEYRNDLGINYLMVNSLSAAENVFLETLARWPDDPVARSHYGLVLKLSGRISESIPHLQGGLSTNHPATRDARLYFHLGDALSRDGKTEEAKKVHRVGVEQGLFRSEYQRSLYNIHHLTARPWWTLKQTTYAEFFKMLETNWKVIRDEGLSAMKLKGLYQDEAENLREMGDWKQFQLFARGNKYGENCKKTPVTCKLIGDFAPARGCKRGQSKFSVMEGGTHVWPHCGPTNCRLRAHLGLVVPPGPVIRVADDSRKWTEGKVIVFDDSFEHEVWHNGSALRLVLIVDVWHPDLSPAEKATLSPI